MTPSNEIENLARMLRITLSDLESGKPPDLALTAQLVAMLATWVSITLASLSTSHPKRIN